MFQAHGYIANKHPPVAAARNACNRAWNASIPEQPALQKMSVPSAKRHDENAVVCFEANNTVQTTTVGTVRSFGMQ